MAKTPSNKKDAKKPAAKQVRDKKLQVKDAEVGKIRGGVGGSPSPPGSPTWSP